MDTTWDKKLPTPGAGLLCLVLLLQPPGHMVSVGWFLGKFGGRSMAPLSCCFQVKKSQLPKHQSVKKHRRERKQGEEESREDTFPP